MPLKFTALIFLILCLFATISSAATAPQEALNRLKSGQSVDLIVEFEVAPVEAAAATMRKQTKRHMDDANVLNFKKQRYKEIKDEVDQATTRPDIQSIFDYSHLPMTFKRFNSVSGLNAYLAHAKVKAVYFDKPLHRVLSQSLPLINQPAVSSAGEQGLGTTVAVIDDGIDYTNAAFGSCTAPGVPSSCRVMTSINFGTGTTDNSHGTNVSAIVLGVAPSTKIAMLNAFSGNSANTSDVISAINWAIANQATYNIVAINMSLGDGSKNTTACSSGNPFSTPVTNAKNTGISVIAASGNEAYTNAISGPACTPGIISVGAVYDANLGGLTWGNNLCTDSSTAADKVTCFSDSASFLTMLAPGALITAAGITEGGTSQATPHISGAIAVLRSTYPLETLAQTQTRLTSTGVKITDIRNNLIKPRLNLLEAARPLNDAFTNRFSITGNSGAVSGVTLLSTKENGEPNHTGNVGSHSVWWKWVAPAAGQLSLDTHGSNFDTLLATYLGNSVSALTPIISNDNDGSAGNTSGLLLQVQAGQEYEIVVDGFNGAQGTSSLNWNLNTSAVANLSVSLSGPSSITLGTPTDYIMTVKNAGPQTATNIQAILTLPNGASFVTGSYGCSATGNTVTCKTGSLASNVMQVFNIQVLWSTISGTETISATTSSDLPDSSAVDNTSTVQIAINSPSDGSTDAPALPAWGMTFLSICMIVQLIRQKNGSSFL